MQRRAKKRGHNDDIVLQIDTCYSGNQAIELGNILGAGPGGFLRRIDATSGPESIGWKMSEDINVFAYTHLEKEEAMGRKYSSPADFISLVTLTSQEKKDFDAGIAALVDYARTQGLSVAESPVLTTLGLDATLPVVEQIGNEALGRVAERGGKRVLDVFNASSGNLLGSTELTLSDQDEDIKKDLLGILTENSQLAALPSLRLTLIDALCGGRSPRLYQYNTPGFSPKDLLGVAPGGEHDDMVALHGAMLGQGKTTALAYGHEAGHNALNRRDLKVELTRTQNGIGLVFYRRDSAKSAGESAYRYVDTLELTPGGKAQELALRSLTAGPYAEHYLLWAMARQLFGADDQALSDRIAVVRDTITAQGGDPVGGVDLRAKALGIEVTGRGSFDQNAAGVLNVIDGLTIVTLLSGPLSQERFLEEFSKTAR